MSVITNGAVYSAGYFACEVQYFRPMRSEETHENHWESPGRCISLPSPETLLHLVGVDLPGSLKGRLDALINLSKISTIRVLLEP